MATIMAMMAPTKAVPQKRYRTECAMNWPVGAQSGLRAPGRPEQEFH
jgi:hypothetical protein